MTELPTGTVTFLFTDIEGSTRLWDEAEELMRTAMVRHDEIVDRILGARHGVNVNPRGEGDSRFIVFPDATDAVTAAIDLQRGLQAEAWDLPRPIKVRIALHTGVADMRGGDYYGSTVNRAARLRSLARGGQTVISASTQQLVQDSLPSGISLRDMGLHGLKDLTRPERVYQVNGDGLPDQFPALKSLEAMRHNLPTQLTELIGREREAAELAGASTPAAFFFEVLDDSGRVVEAIPLTSGAVIGRAAPDSDPEIPIPMDCSSASRVHAQLEANEGGLVLTDRSRFGTIVNGKLVQAGSVELHHGDDLVFGLREDGWHVRLRSGTKSAIYTSPADALEMLAVKDHPREVRIGRLEVDEHLGDRAFRLLKFLADNRGKWFPVSHLEGVLWPDPDKAPYQMNQALSRSKKAINDLLAPYLKGQDAIESAAYRGYRLKPRLDST